MNSYLRWGGDPAVLVREKDSLLNVLTNQHWTFGKNWDEAFGDEGKKVAQMAREEVLKAAQELIQKQVPMDAEGASWTPLTTALFNDQKEMVELFIQNGVARSWDQEKWKGEISIARMRGHPELAEMLEFLSMKP